jgi:hypothetical protein
LPQFAKGACASRAPIGSAACAAVYWELKTASCSAKMTAAAAARKARRFAMAALRRIGSDEATLVARESGTENFNRKTQTNVRAKYHRL